MWWSENCKDADQTPRSVPSVVYLSLSDTILVADAARIEMWSTGINFITTIMHLINSLASPPIHFSRIHVVNVRNLRCSFVCVLFVSKCNLLDLFLLWKENNYTFGVGSCIRRERTVFSLRSIIFRMALCAWNTNRKSWSEDVRVVLGLFSQYYLSCNTCWSSYLSLPNLKAIHWRIKVTYNFEKWLT